MAEIVQSPGLTGAQRSAQSAFVKKAQKAKVYKIPSSFDADKAFAPYRKKYKVSFTHPSSPGKPVVLDTRNSLVDSRKLFNEMRESFGMTAGEFGAVFGVNKRTADGWSWDGTGTGEIRYPGAKALAKLAIYLGSA